MNIREENSKTDWDLHLKPSKGTVFGYILKPEDMERIVKDQAESLLRSRRLPLVLDLDDTLVRAVGDSPGRYVLPEDALTGILD